MQHGGRISCCSELWTDESIVSSCRSDSFEQENNEVSPHPAYLTVRDRRSKMEQADACRYFPVCLLLGPLPLKASRNANQDRRSLQECNGTRHDSEDEDGNSNYDKTTRTNSCDSTSDFGANRLLCFAASLNNVSTESGILSSCDSMQAIPHVHSRECL